MHVILMSILASVVGTALGGLLAAVLGSKSDKLTGLALSFAGGVMTSISFFELLPEAIEHSNMAVAVAGLAGGAAVVLGLNYLLDRITNAGGKNPKLHETYQELYHESELLARKKSMMRSGLLMLCAIAIHDIPEGLVIGATGRHDTALAVTLAVMLAVHNVPEGIAIAAPLIAGGMGRWKTFLLTVVEGLPSVAGALIGYYVGGISGVAVALSLSAAAGAMLYVVFGEILPQSIVMRKDRAPMIVLLAGIVLGMLLSKI